MLPHQGSTKLNIMITNLYTKPNKIVAKASICLRRFLPGFLLVGLMMLGGVGWGQTLYDSYTDGNFTTGPVWGGNTSSWSIVANSDAAAGATGSNTLRLASTGTATVYLSSQITNWGPSQEWGFWLGRRGQAATGANTSYFWLYANESNLTSGTVDGYRIALGDNTGGDEIRLEYIVNGAVSSTVITSSGSIANGQTDYGFLVRVTRSSTGAWALFTSTLPTSNGSGAIATDIPSSANTTVNQGLATNNTLVPAANGYVGVAALHSAGVDGIVGAEFDQIYFTTISPLTPQNGDIVFTEVNSRGDGFEFLTMKRMDLSTLSFTDNGICSNDLFRLNETNSIPTNVAAWTDVPAGTLVRIAMDNTGTNDNNVFDGTLWFTSNTGNINASGESIIAYTGTANGAAGCGGSGTNFYISGIIWETTWNTGATNTDNSKAPGTATDFEAGNNDNRYYTGTALGSAATLKGTLANGIRRIADWGGDNNDPKAFTNVTLKNIQFNESTLSGTLSFTGQSATSVSVDASALTTDGISDTRYMVVVRNAANPDNPVDRYTCYSSVSGNFTTAPSVVTVVSGQTATNTCGTPTNGNGKVVYFDYDLPDNLIVTNLTTGVNYQFEVWAVNGNGYSANISSNVVSGNFTPTVPSNTTDYFRSNVTTGNWETPGSWESSPDNTNWNTATLAPTSSANTITIRNGHTIQVNTTVTLDQTILVGKLEILNNGTLSLQNGTGTDLTIQSGGELNTNAFRNYNLEMTYATSSTIIVQTGGKISIGTGAGVGGSGYDAFTTRSGNTWQTGSIYEWNNTGTFASSGITYFATAPVGTKPIFRVTLIGVTSPGGGSATTINGILEVNSSFTFIGGGTKTFRDGITGTATLTLSSVLGTTSITASDAILGGSITLVINRALSITNLEIPTGASVTLSNISTNGVTKGSSGVLTVNGTLNITTVTISNTTGSIDINGTLITSKPEGLLGSGANVASGTINVNNNSTVEYNANVSQTITGSLNYYNLVLSGTGGTKTPSSATTINDNGSLTISGAVNLDAGSANIGPSNTTNATAFTMNSTGVFILGTTGSGRALPWMDGTYTVTSGIIRYNGSSQTIRNKTYQNIEVTGSDVGNSIGNISLNNNGTFTVKTGGTFSINANAIVGPSGTQTVTVENGGFFNCGNEEGLVGGTPDFGNPSAAIRDDIETIDLQVGSTINYTRSTTDQKITARSDYKNVTISGGSLKILQGASNIAGALTMNTGIVNNTSSNILTLGPSTTTSGASAASFINGPLAKQVNSTTTAAFIFPIGSTNPATRYRPLEIADYIHDGANTATYTASFTYGNTQSDPGLSKDLFDLVDGIWATQYWNVTKSGTAPAGTRVGLFYTNPVDGGWSVAPDATNNVAVATYNGTEWRFTKPEGNFNNYPLFEEAIDNNIVSQVVYSEQLTSFSPFTIGHGLFSLLVLPVKILDFSATAKEPDALLDWQLADAATLAYTLVEHSQNGRDFIPLGKVNPVTGQQYQFRHAAPGTGLHYYRLKLVEKDGSSTYSPVEQLRLGQSQTLIVGMAGNPVIGGQARIRIFSAVNQSADVRVVDLSGRVLLQRKINLRAGENLPIISLPQGGTGMYKMQVSTADGVSATLSFIQ